jgi:hypothetical protein
MIVPLNVVTPSSLRWCQDSNRVLVIDEQSEMAVSLSGFNAAVWKWFALSYPYVDVLRFAQVFLDLPIEQTRDQLNQLLNHWIELGLLVEEEARWPT